MKNRIVENLLNEVGSYGREPGATAVSAYAKHLADLKNTLKSINAEVGKHAAQSAKEPKNWGFVGDISHLNELAEEMLRFLKNEG